MFWYKLYKHSLGYPPDTDGFLIFHLGRSSYLSFYLSPQASGAEIKLKAELKIECIEASVHDITAALKSYMQSSEGLFDRDYLKLQYPCRSKLNTYVWLDHECKLI